MLSIITCHILQGLDNTLSSYVNVGVMIFFFLSGYLFGNKEIDNTVTWYLKKYKKLILPLAILSIALYSVEYLVYTRVETKEVLFSISIGLGGYYGIPYLLSHTWFVSALLICYLITPIVLQNLKIAEKENSNKKFILLSLLLFAILISLELFRVVNVQMIYLAVYTAGYLFSKRYLDENNEITKKGLNILLGISIISLIIFPFRVHLQENPSIINLPYINSHQLILIHQATFGIMLFSVMYLSFKKIKNKFVVTIFNLSDKFSYEIYLVHQIFILGFYSILFWSKNLYLNIILIFILSIVGGVILHYITSLVDLIYCKIKVKVTRKKY